MLQQYVYVSTATRLLADEDLDAILSSARAFNAREGISGVLMYADGTFFQLLEAEPRTIDAVLVRIERDHRHYGITPMLRHDVDARSFPDWAMGFRRMTREQAQTEGWFDLRTAQALPAAAGVSPSPGSILVKRFFSANS